LNATLLTCRNGSACRADSKAKTSAGRAMGGGLEYAAWDNLTRKVEYRPVDLGDRTLRLAARNPSTGNGYMTAKFDNAFDIVRAGFNVEF
jgi:opacity protein-like surface antigen